ANAQAAGADAQAAASAARSFSMPNMSGVFNQDWRSRFSTGALPSIPNINIGTVRCTTAGQTGCISIPNIPYPTF
ncbi:MAG: hypothetical protein ABL958_12630, partial [Bdellovibrionia bacterium]